MADCSLTRPHAASHVVDHRSPSGFTPRAVHGHLCAQYAYRVAPSPVQVQPTRRARLPPTIDHALLTSAASHPRCRLQVMNTRSNIGPEEVDRGQTVPFSPIIHGVMGFPTSDHAAIQGH